jgi:hypothetical protein
MNRTLWPTLLLLLPLMGAAPAPANGDAKEDDGPTMPAKEDLPTPAVPGMGNLGGGRLALPVAVRFADAVSQETPVASRQTGKVTSKTAAPVAGLSKYALAISRGFFEEASWGAEGKAGKGRELVITGIKVLAQQGPLYEVQVSVDRVQDGRRLGSATGMGMVAPDRSNDRAAAMFAPGLFGAAIAHDASRAKPQKDQVAILQATLQAYERAVAQLGAYWAGEQMQEEMMKKARK